MPKVNKDEKFVMEEVVEVMPKPPKVMVRAIKEKRYSFEQWAKLRKKPERHLKGLRAFIGTRAASKFSLEKWDEIFKAY